MTTSLEATLVLAAQHNCILRPTSCSDGSRVAWLIDKQGLETMLGSVRKDWLPRINTKLEEAILVAAATNNWQPKLHTCQNCRVSWVLVQSGGPAITLGSVRNLDPANKAHTEKPKSYCLTNSTD